MNEIIMIECQLEVCIRKYDVDIKGLQQCLRNHKNISNKEIAAKLNIPLTQVEHYFRTDKYFAIPDSNIWYDLKSLLNIEETQFDKSIMTFITKPGVYEKANRFYYVEGISPTICCGDDIKVCYYE